MDAESVDLLVEFTEAGYVGFDGGNEVPVQGFVFDVPACHGRISGLVAVALFLAEDCFAVDPAGSHQPRQQRFAAHSDPMGTVPEGKECSLEDIICQMVGDQRMRQPGHGAAVAVVNLSERPLTPFDDLLQQDGISIAVAAMEGPWTLPGPSADLSLTPPCWCS